MRVNITGKNCKVSDHLKDTIEKKVQKLGKYFSDDIDADVMLTEEKKYKKTEVTIKARNMIFRAEDRADEFYDGIDNVVSKLSSQMSRFKQKLIADKQFLGIGFKGASAKSFLTSIDSLDSIVLLLIFCAGLLAVIVLYNLANINITERVREIATIKVLGFFDGETSAYIYRENIISTLLGIAIGLGLGNRGRLLGTELIALGVYAFQIGFSALWLKYFKFGPVEWVWRMLTYGKWLPLRQKESV